MRTWIALLAAGLLALSVAGPVAAGAHVINQTGSWIEGDGYWYSVDAGTGIETMGEVWVVQEKGQPGFINYLYEQTGRWVECTPVAGKATGIAPNDTTIGGFQGTLINGYGDATLVTDRTLTGLTASGMAYVETALVDDCAGTYEVISSGEVPFTATFTGNGDLVTSRSFGSDKIPGVLNGHSSYKGSSRAALGTVDFGAETRAFVDGYIASVSWTDHCNGRGCGY